MSTKIYEAYRVKGEAFKIAETLREVFVPFIKKSIRKHIQMWQDMPEDKFREMVKTMLPDHVLPDKLTLLAYSDVLNLVFKKQKNSPYRNWDDLSVSLTLRKSGKYVYIIPYFGCFYDRQGVRFIFENKIPRLEEYGYWNNTDKPDGVTNQEWGQRKRIWNKFIEKWDSNYLVLDIVNTDNFYTIDPCWQEVWGKNK